MAFKDLLDRFKKGLSRTAQLFDVRSWFGRKVDQAFLDELEATLDPGRHRREVDRRIIDRVRRSSPTGRPTRTCSSWSRGSSRRSWPTRGRATLIVSRAKPTVYLIAGVNGSGKTTSIAKLAQRLKNEGKSILLAACDTFRAAAADQLTIWAERSGSDIVKGAPGADPASVAHDACDRALARGSTS